MQEMNWALMIVLCLVALLIGAAVAGFLAYRKGVANGAEQRKQQAEAAIGSAEKEAGRILEDAKKRQRQSARMPWWKQKMRSINSALRRKRNQGQTL